MCRSKLSEVDKNYIKLNYKKLPTQTIADKLGASIKTIYNYAMILGISSRKKYYTKHDDEILKKNYGTISLKKLSGLLGKTEISLSHRVRRLHLKNKKWDLTGTKHRKIKILSFHHMGEKGRYWECECECGKKFILSAKDLRNRTHCGNNSIHEKGANNHAYKGMEGISGTYFSSIRAGARKRNLIFKVTKKYLSDLFKIQKQRCKLSGRPLIPKTSCKKDIGTASLDRIDSKQGYIIGNVQWVHKDFNRLKMAWENDIFISMCTEVGQNNNINK